MNGTTRASGPLAGFRVVEIAGIGPGPFCAMMLADMGADVLRVDRVGGEAADPRPGDFLVRRGRRSAAVNLKDPEGVETVLRLVDGADALVEGFRPGVAERLGIGPKTCLDRNPRLVYGRMTGWGQSGPLASAAGHDINYIALAAALCHIGRVGEKPVPPLNLVGDFGGGGLLLAFGIVSALLERERSGQGQVVDAAMVDGAAVLMTMFFSMREVGRWSDARGMNLIDSGAPFYEVYETADAKYVALGSIEPEFYAEFVRRAGLAADDLPPQMDVDSWPAVKERFAAVFRTRTQAEWCALLEGTDACFAPVLSMAEAPLHPHNRERGTFVEYDGVMQPAPAPRFSRTPPAIQSPPPKPGEHTAEALAAWGFTDDEITSLRERGAVGS